MLFLPVVIVSRRQQDSTEWDWDLDDDDETKPGDEIERRQDERGGEYAN